MSEVSLTRKTAAEFLGTFWLVLGGCGSAVLAAAFPGLGIGFHGLALVFGLTVLTMAFAIGQLWVRHWPGLCARCWQARLCRRPRPRKKYCRKASTTG